MMKQGFICFLILLQTACSIKSKEAVVHHENKINDATIEEKNSNQVEYKEKIDTQSFYQKTISKDKDKYTDVLLPLSKIVLNTKHIDDKTLYSAQDLKYSLQIFQTQYLYALKTDPSKVEIITKDYIAFLNYKCTINALTDCKTHPFLKQDSNSSAIVLKIAQGQDDITKKIELLKIAIALQNSSNADEIKKESIQLLKAYVQSQTLVAKENKVDTLNLKDNSNSARIKFQVNINFFLNVLSSLNIGANDLDSFQSFLLLKNSLDVLGKNFYNFIFQSLSKSQNLDSSSQYKLIDQWYRVLQANESTNEFSWTNLKSKIPKQVRLKTMSLEDLKEKGLAALLIYQVATDLSAQASLVDQQNKKEFLEKNPELAMEILETQLKLHFFSLALPSYQIIKKELNTPVVANAAPQKLLDLMTERGNNGLQPIWAGFNKVTDHFSYFVHQTFGQLSPISQRFRIFQENIVTSQKVFVFMPMMFMVLHSIDKKNYSDTLSISEITGTTVSISGPLLLYEVLQGKMSSIYGIKEDTAATALTQYQVLHALAATVQFQIPELFDVKKDQFLEAFVDASVRVPKEKIKKTEDILEKIGFGPFDSSGSYAQKIGKVHETLKLCEQPGSLAVPMKLSDIRRRNYLGGLDNMVDINDQMKPFAELAFYNTEGPYNTSIDEVLEVVRSELDPLIDQLTLIEQIGNVALSAKTELKDKRDRLLARALELESKVTSCALKLDQTERSRQERFVQRELLLNKKIIAIAHWIENDVTQASLPEFFKSKLSLNRQQKIAIAQEWMLQSVYFPLKTAAPNLYRELEGFNFFDINEETQTLMINTRSLHAYYRLAIWTQEPEQQKEVRVVISYAEPFQLLVKEFNSKDTFAVNSVAFKNDDTFLETQLARTWFKDFFQATRIDANFQNALRGILKVKTARWKMLTSYNWSALNYNSCQQDCIDKRRLEIEKGFRELIKTSVNFLSYFQVTAEKEKYLNVLAVDTPVGIDDQIKQSYVTTSLYPDSIFTKSINNVGVLSTSLVGLADVLFRLSTSVFLGTRPLYTLVDQYFPNSGRATQLPGVASVDSEKSSLKAADLYTRRALPIDLQDEKGTMPKERIIELTTLGLALSRTQEEQFLVSIDKQLDKNFRMLTVAPMLRELEIREVVFETIQKYESQWQKPSIRFSVTKDDNFRNPWLVSTSYLGITQEQQKEFHRLTKGVFELKK